MFRIIAFAGCVRHHRPLANVPRTLIGLGLALVAAVVTNIAYSLEHDAAAELPPLSPSRPIRSARLLLRERCWLTAFGIESAAGFTYVAGRCAAMLALVQAVTGLRRFFIPSATTRGHRPCLRAPRADRRRARARRPRSASGPVTGWTSPVDRHRSADWRDRLARGVRRRGCAPDRRADASRPRRLARPRRRLSPRGRRHVGEARRLRRVVVRRNRRADRRVRGVMVPVHAYRMAT